MAMVRYIEVFGTENQMIELKTLTRNNSNVTTTILKQDTFSPNGRAMEYYHLKMVGDDDELTKLLKIIGGQSFNL